MTERLQQVIDQVIQLPQAEQDVIATRILEEVEDIAEARHWTDMLANSDVTLDRLAVVALEEHIQGKTRPLEELLDEPI